MQGLYNIFIFGESSLTSCTTNPNLYFLIINGKYIVLLLYVNDLILAGDNNQEMNNVEERLALEFEMTKIKKPKHFLGS